MKRFIKNKKADADTYITTGKWAYFILVIFLTAITIVGFVGKGYSFVQSKATTPVNLEEDILIAQLVNVCFSYQEEEGELRGRTYQNIIDIRKFTKERLDICNIDSVSATLTSINGEFEPITIRATKTTVDNTFTQYVLVRVQDKIIPARLTVIL